MNKMIFSNKILNNKINKEKSTNKLNNNNNLLGGNVPILKNENNNLIGGSVVLRDTKKYKPIKLKI